jgi:23S rRNA (uracil1939-C5)-methyltransferase
MTPRRLNALRQNNHPGPAVSAEIIIEALGAQGDGLAHLGGQAVHVPLTLAGETVRAEVAGDRGELLEVLSPSPHRIAPACRHYGACGGCALQHFEPSAYLAWKVARVEKLLAREGLHPEFEPAFAAPTGSRRRLALHARRDDRPDLARLGFKARKSWSLVEISECPVALPALARALPGLKRLAAPLLEHAKSAPTLHLTLTDTGLDVGVTGVENKAGGLSGDARLKVGQIAAELDLARVTLMGETLYQARQPVVRFGKAAVALPPEGFLQAVAAAETAMAERVLAAAAGAKRAADLFCGAGAFTFRLAEIAQVYAADGAAPAVAALKAALGTPGLKPITAETRDLTRRPVLASELKNTDVVVFDPPRAGAAEQAGEIARSKVPQAVGISCNPASFVRDAAILARGGFTLERVMPVDQFLWSPHIELVGVFRR